MTRRLMSALGAALLLAMTTAAQLLAQTPQKEFVPFNRARSRSPFQRRRSSSLRTGSSGSPSLLYLVLLWRRVANVERELGDLNRRLGSAKRS